MSSRLISESSANKRNTGKGPLNGNIFVNGEIVHVPGYIEYHQRRLALTIKKLRDIGARRIVEVGSHPWVMTAYLVDDSSFELCATVSAEEVTKWPDDIGVKTQQLRIRTPRGNKACFVNYSANIERTRFDIEETPDSALACEIVEHLIRSPHVMFLNINHWLPLSGKLLITSPNGAQFFNPFRRGSRSPEGYRSNIYERHSYLYTLRELCELVALCGFKVLEAGYWDVIERLGFSRIYSVPSHLPWQYFQEKFGKTIYVVAEKDRDVKELEKCPRVYDSRGDWEFIKKEE